MCLVLMSKHYFVVHIKHCCMLMAWALPPAQTIQRAKLCLTTVKKHMLMRCFIAFIMLHKNVARGSSKHVTHMSTPAGGSADGDGGVDMELARPVTHADFVGAMKKVGPSITRGSEVAVSPGRISQIHRHTSTHGHLHARMHARRPSRMHAARIKQICSAVSTPQACVVCQHCEVNTFCLEEESCTVVVTVNSQPTGAQGASRSPRQAEC